MSGCLSSRWSANLQRKSCRRLQFEPSGRRLGQRKVSAFWPKVGRPRASTMRPDNALLTDACGPVGSLKSDCDWGRQSWFPSQHNWHAGSTQPHTSPQRKQGKCLIRVLRKSTCLPSGAFTEQLFQDCTAAFPIHCSPNYFKPAEPDQQRPVLPTDSTRCDSPKTTRAHRYCPLPSMRRCTSTTGFRKTRFRGDPHRIAQLLCPCTVDQITSDAAEPDLRRLA